MNIQNRYNGTAGLRTVNLGYIEKFKINAKPYIEKQGNNQNIPQNTSNATTVIRYKTTSTPKIVKHIKSVDCIVANADKMPSTSENVFAFVCLVDHIIKT